MTSCKRKRGCSVDAGTKTQSVSSTERILERAIQVIDEAGEVAIRTNPIAAECGVTPPILYRAFQSREGLVIAAQAERYRRATEAAAQRMFDLVKSATSKEDLIAKVSASLDFIYDPGRHTNRSIRAGVIGSAVSRPELQKQIAEIDAAYSAQIADAYSVAVNKGWIDADINLAAVALWAQGITNARINVEFSNNAELSTAWNALAKRAILDAIFG